MTIKKDNTMLTVYTAVQLTARELGRKLLTEDVIRKDAGASPMDAIFLSSWTACLSKKFSIHVSD